jgi:hypothetical protein
LHSRTLAKVAESLIGYVTRAALAGVRCTGGSATVQTEALPWHIRYASFRGTLPNISGITIHSIGESYRIQDTGGPPCVEISGSGEPHEFEIGILVEARKAVSWVANGLRRILMRGEALCAFGGEVSLSGTGTPTVLNAATQITITLI